MSGRQGLPDAAAISRRLKAMGKETKIGLAVIGVLVTIFSVLLVRHFRAGHLPPRGTEMAQTPIEPLSSAGMSSVDTSVTSSESIAGSKLWDTPSETVAQVPTEDPYPNELADSSPTDDPYAQPIETAAADDPADAAPTAPVGRSPFHRGPAVETPAAAPAATAATNPLRRASVTMPLEDAGAPYSEPETAEPEGTLMTLPPADGVAAAEPADSEFGQYGSTSSAAEPHDPFAATAPVSQADAAARDPFEAAPQAVMADEPAPAQDAFGVQGHFQDAGDSTGQFAEDEIGQSGEDEFPDAPSGPNAFDRQRSTAQNPATQPRQQFAPSDWQASPPAAQREMAEPHVAQPQMVQPQMAQPQMAQPRFTQPDAPAPLPIENGKYTVQPGDTLWSISEAVYGTGGYFKALGEHNRRVLPHSDVLAVGSQLSVPPREDLECDYPSLCPKPRKSALVSPRAQSYPARPVSGRDIYIVNEGDTLFDIARHELGKASRWAEIYELNRDLLGEDFDYLRPGTELRMPPREVQSTAQGGTSRY
jgi:nucleoid-associated protein YgaU